MCAVTDYSSVHGRQEVKSYTICTVGGKKQQRRRHGHWVCIHQLNRVNSQNGYGRQDRTIKLLYYYFFLVVKIPGVKHTKKIKMLDGQLIECCAKARSWSVVAWQKCIVIIIIISIIIITGSCERVHWTPVHPASCLSDLSLQRFYTYTHTVTVLLVGGVA